MIQTNLQTAFQKEKNPCTNSTDIYIIMPQRYNRRKMKEFSELSSYKLLFNPNKILFQNSIQTFIQNIHTEGQNIIKH